MNRDIKIVGDSIAFTNRGIGFFQAGISHEILALISDLQEENEKLHNQYDLMEDSLDEKQEVIDKAVEIYESRNTIEIKKKRFMEDKSTATLMYEVLIDIEIEDESNE